MSTQCSGWNSSRQTVTETGTAGFNLLAENGDGSQTQLNGAIISSQRIDSVEPTDYEFAAAADATIFYLGGISIDGRVDEFGPFLLGEPWGVYSAPDGIDFQHSIWLPVVR